MYIIAAATTSALFLAAGWRSTYVASTRTMPRAYTGGSAAYSFADIETGLAVALPRLALAIAPRRITLDVAAQPGLLTQLARPGLANVLEMLISAVVCCGHVERLLLTVWESRGRIAVRMIDDAAAANLDVRRTVLMGLAGRVGECGGTLDSAVEPGGSIVTIWLPCDLLVT
jgi:hypothetical protein